MIKIDDEYNKYDGSKKSEFNFTIICDPNKSNSYEIQNCNFNQHPTIKIDRNIEVEHILITFSNCNFENPLFLNDHYIKCSIKTISFRFFRCIFSMGITIEKDIDYLQIRNSYSNLLHFEENIIGKLQLRNFFCNEINLTAKHFNIIQIAYETNKLSSLIYKDNIDLLDEFFIKKENIFINLYSNFDNAYFLGYGYIEQNIKKHPLQYLINNSNFNNLNLNLNFDSRYYNNIINGNLFLNSVRFNYLKIEGYISSLNIKNSDIRQFSSNEFTTENTFISNLTCYYALNTNINKPKKISEKNIFNVSNSNLKNVTFWNSDFSSYDIVNFFESFIEDCRLSLVNFPKEITNKEYIFDDIVNHFDYKRASYENYRQLCLVFNKNGDIKNALIMKANQMKALLNFRELDNKSKLILKINKITNDFGNSSSSALICILVSSVVLYLLFLATIFGISTQLIFCFFENNYFKYYFSIILNPLSTTTKLDELNTNNWTYAVIFISKIVMAFLYFQFVAAYRRFGKSENK